MYCYKCGSPNLADAKFCRGCGASLEVILMALSGQIAPNHTAKEQAGTGSIEPACESHATSESSSAVSTMSVDQWNESRAKAVHQLLSGAVFTAISGGLLAACLLSRFGWGWVWLWLAFFGWMAYMGVMNLAQGLGKYAEARIMLAPRSASGRMQTGLLPSPSGSSTNPILIPPERVSESQNPPASVTESTTRHLG